MAAFEKSPDPEIPPTRGAFLRHVRQAGGMSLQEVCDRSGLNTSYLSQLELGRIESVKIDNLEPIARGYVQPVEFILGAYGVEIPTKIDPETAAISQVIARLDDDGKKAVLLYAEFRAQYRPTIE